MNRLIIQTNTGKARQYYEKHQGQEMTEKLSLISHKCAELAEEAVKTDDPLAYMAEHITVYARSIFPKAPENFISSIAVFSVQGLVVLMENLMGIKCVESDVEFLRGNNREDKGTN